MSEMRNKISPDRYALFILLCLYFGALIRALSHLFLDKKYFYDMFRLLHLIDGIAKTDDRSFNYAANVFRIVRLDLVTWTIVIFIITFVILAAFLIRYRPLINKRSFFLFLPAVVLIFNIYNNTLSKDFMQFVISMLLILIFINFDLRYSIVINTIIVYIFSCLFREYLLFNLIFFFALCFVFYGRKSKKKRVFNACIGIVLFIVLFIAVRNIYPGRLHRLVDIRVVTNLNRGDAITMMNDVLHNEGYNPIIFAFNYMVNLVRLVIPVELLRMPSMKYLVFFLYQVWETVVVILSIRNWAGLDRRDRVIILFFISMVLTQALFEPDFGSYLRHHVSYLPFIYYTIFRAAPSGKVKGSRLKMVHVVESFGSGTYSFLVNLCSSLAGEFDIVLVYSVRPETPPCFREDFDKSVRFLHVPMVREISLFRDIRALMGLIAVIRRENPDIVHLHSSKAGFLGRLACFLMGFDGLVFYNAHGFSFLQMERGGWKRRVYYSLEKFAAFLNGTLVAVSDGEYREALKITKRAFKIDNAIDLSSVTDYIVETSRQKTSLTIGTMGRITSQKDPHLFNKIAERYPEFEFVWVGDGEMRDVLKEPNISIAGWVSRTEALKVVSTMDIYMQTSRFEGMSIALLEAMALKKPVIVSDVIGNRDTVTHGENGYLAGGLDDFLKYIDILRDGELRTETGERAYIRVRDSYSSHAMSERYRDMYLSHLNFRGRQVLYGQDT